MRFLAPIHVTTMSLGDVSWEQLAPGIMVDGVIEATDQHSHPGQTAVLDLEAGVFVIEIPDLCGHCRGVGSVLANPPTNHELMQGTLVRGSPEYAVRTTTFKACGHCGGAPARHFDSIPRGWTSG